MLLRCVWDHQGATTAGSPFKADRDLWLSPESRLLADQPGVEDFVYDGQGKRLVLPQDISVEEPLPLILLGPGKTLQLKNVKLVYAASLPACLQLGPGNKLCPCHLPIIHTGSGMPYNCWMLLLPFAFVQAMLLLLTYRHQCQFMPATFQRPEAALYGG